MAFKNTILVASTLILTANVKAATISYDGSTLPDSSWNFVSNGSEDHSVFLNEGSLRMIDSTLLVGNSLGYIKPFSFDSSEVIDVEFRARVFSGESAATSLTNQDYSAPFGIWLHDGLVSGDGNRG